MTAFISWLTAALFALGLLIYFWSVIMIWILVADCTENLNIFALGMALAFAFLFSAAKQLLAAVIRICCFGTKYERYDI